MACFLDIRARTPTPANTQKRERCSLGHRLPPGVTTRAGHGGRPGQEPVLSLQVPSWGLSGAGQPEGGGVLSGARPGAGLVWLWVSVGPRRGCRWWLQEPHSRGRGWDSGAVQCVGGKQASPWPYCGRRAPGSGLGAQGVGVSRGAPRVGRAGVRGRRPRRACARACARPSAVLKDTSRGGGRAVSGDVTARPTDNLSVPEPRSETHGGGCGGGGGGGQRRPGAGEQELGAEAVTPRTRPAPLAASPALLHPGQWRPGGSWAPRRRRNGLR